MRTACPTFELENTKPASSGLAGCCLRQGVGQSRGALWAPVLSVAVGPVLFVHLNTEPCLTCQTVLPSIDVTGEMAWAVLWRRLGLGGALCAIGDAVCIVFIYFPFLLAARPTPLPFPCSFPPCPQLCLGQPSPVPLRPQGLQEAGGHPRSLAWGGFWGRVPPGLPPPGALGPAALGRCLLGQARGPPALPPLPGRRPRRGTTSPRMPRGGLHFPASPAASRWGGGGQREEASDYISQHPLSLNGGRLPTVAGAAGGA